MDVWREREELEKVEGGGVGIRTEGKMSWRFTEAEFFVHFKKIFLLHSMFQTTETRVGSVHLGPVLHLGSN